MSATHSAGVRRLRTAASVLAVTVVTAFSFNSAATQRTAVGPLDVHVALAATPGGSTIIDLPPLGTISADTHAGPVAVRATLRSVDIDGLQRVAVTGLPSEDDIAVWRAALVGAVALAALKGFVAALLAAVIVSAALFGSRSAVLRTLALTAAGLSVAATVAGVTFDADAFREPRFEGALTYAPALVELAQVREDTITGLQRQISSLASDLAAYYAVPQSYESAGALAGTLRVLHVSDLHLDPVGMQLSLDLASAYDVDLVINTGDLSHFGTAAETAAAVAQMGPRPSVYVPGNHDSPQLVAALDALPNLTVLDDETTRTATGLLVAGVPDPAAAGPGVEPDRDAAAEAGRAAAARLEAAGIVPDLVVVHDPASGDAFEGFAPIVLSGHTHTPLLEQRQGTWFLGVGTTGGVHFTELRSDPHIPHSAAVLYFRRGPAGPVLVAIDQVEVYGKTRRSSVARTLVEPGSTDD